MKRTNRTRQTAARATRGRTRGRPQLVPSAAAVVRLLRRIDELERRLDDQVDDLERRVNTLDEVARDLAVRLEKLISVMPIPPRVTESLRTAGFEPATAAAPAPG